MANRLRLDTREVRHGPRWTIGVQVSSDCDRVTAALVATVGRGTDLRAEVADVSAAPIPREATSLFTQLIQPGLVSTDSDFAGRITSLRAQLAEVEALVIGNLVARSEAARTGLLGSPLAMPLLPVSRLCLFPQHARWQRPAGSAGR